MLCSLSKDSSTAQKTSFELMQSPKTVIQPVTINGKTTIDYTKLVPNTDYQYSLSVNENSLVSLNFDNNYYYINVLDKLGKQIGQLSYYNNKVVNFRKR